MKGFVFSLETLLKKRSEEVEKFQKEMAPVITHYNKISDQENKLAKNLSKGLLSEAGVGQDYLWQLSHIYRHLQVEKKNVENELLKWQEKLAEKIKNQKILEVIKERRHREWKKKLNKQIEKNSEELILKYF